MDVLTNSQLSALMKSVIVLASAILGTFGPEQLCYGAPLHNLIILEVHKRSADAATESKCTGKEFYWDSERGTCNRCTVCQTGWGSTHECGYGRGRRATCRKCEDGITFQNINGSTAQCEPCNNCVDKVVETICTSLNDSVCGPCKDGYGPDPSWPDLCSPCKHFNDDEKPPECLQKDPTGTLLISSVSASLTTDTSSQTSSPALGDQGGQFPGWATGLIVAVFVVVVVVVAAKLCVWRRSSKTQGNQQQKCDDTDPKDTQKENCTDKNVTDQSVDTSPKDNNNGNALANSDVRQEKDCASNDAQDTKEVFVDMHNLPNENSTLLANPDLSNVEKTLRLPIDEVGQEGCHASGSLKNQPIQEEWGTENERTPLGKTPTRPMVYSEKPKVGVAKRRRILSEGAVPDEPPTIQPLQPKVREKCKKNEREMKEKKFKDDFQKACSHGTKIHWDDLEHGTRKTCSQLMTPEDSFSSTDFRTLGEILGLKRQTQLKDCNNLDDVFHKLHKIRNVPLDMEEVLLKLREIQRMDVVRVLVDDITNKKPTCKCVS